MQVCSIYDVKTENGPEARVLLPTLAQLLYTPVCKSHYEFNTVGNGLEALQAFQNAQKPYDIVLMGTQTHLNTCCTILTIK